MGGLARRMPQTALVFAVGTLSLAGIPLFGGFLSKEEILGAVWAGGLPGPFALLVVVAFLTAFYMFRVVFLAFYGGREASGHPHDPPMTMSLPLWILAAGSMAVGIYFTFVHPEPEFESPTWLMPVAVGSAVAGILLAWLTYQRHAIEPARLAATFGPIRRAALARFWIDDVFEWLYGVAILGFARVIGWFDRYLVDGVLNAVSAWTVAAGDDMRSMQTGRAQDYVYGVALGVLALVIWIQWVTA
jgi:NADH-quinone oxidoreductase subunit L